MSNKSDICRSVCNFDTFKDNVTENRTFKDQNGGFLLKKTWWHFCNSITFRDYCDSASYIYGSIWLFHRFISVDFTAERINIHD
jgi:hypothetical protein